MRTPHLLLYGHFGVGNIGNDSTLAALLANLQHYHPNATITCVCSGPQVVAQRFGIATLPIDIAEDRNLRQSTPASHSVRRLMARVVDEADFWLRRTRWLRSVDQFIVVGTGALDDMAVRPWNMPYDLFKWCRAAKLAGTKVVFLSVGAGPIAHPLSRALMLNALQTASYRSYRDRASQEYLQRVGFNTTNDSVYPDLVFSLPTPTGMPTAARLPIQTIGLGVIGYYGWRHDQRLGEPLYQAYINKLQQFAGWLLDQGYSIRLLTGDYPTDQRPVDDLLTYVRTQGTAAWAKRLFAEPMTDVNALFQQLAQTDLVVASRFHNVLCALMLERPVLSIGYNVKNDALMAEMGLAAYCQHIEHFSVDQLTQQFCALRADYNGAVQRIQRQSAHNRQLLAEQYQRVGWTTDKLRHSY